MSKEKEVKQAQTNKVWNTDVFFKTLTIIIAFWMIYLQFEVNSLGKSKLADDIIISSPQVDYRPLSVGEAINISLDVTNNYDGAILTTIELDEVRLNGKKESSFRTHTWITPPEQKVEGDSEKSFISTFETNKRGEYELIFVIFYNYPQDEDPRKGKSRFYELSFTYTQKEK